MASAEKVVVEIDADVGNTPSDLGKVNSGLKNAKKNTSGLRAEAMSLNESVNMVNGNLGRTLGLFAMIAKHPIVMVIAAITGAIMYMTSAMKTNEEGANMLSEKWAYVAGLFQTASKIIGEDLVEAIKAAGGLTDWVKQKFKEAWEDIVKGAKATVKWFKDLFKILKEGGKGDVLRKLWEDTGKVIENVKQATTEATTFFKEVEKGASALEKWKKESNAIRIAHRAARLEISATELILQKQRAIMNDTNKSLDERYAASKKVRELIGEQADAEEKILSDKIRLLKQEIALKGESTERLDALNKLEIDYNTALKNREVQFYTLNAFESRLHAERRQRWKDEVKWYRDQEQEELDLLKAKLKTQAELETDLYDKKRLLLEAEVFDKQLQLAEMYTDEAEYNEALLKLKEWEANESRKIDEEEKEAAFKVAQYKRNVVASLFGSLAEMAEENTQLQKGLLAAEAAMSTWAAAAKALNGPPVWRWVEFAAVIAAGLATVANIYSTDTSGKSRPTASASTPPPEIINQSPDLPVESQQEIRAYIVEDDLIKSGNSINSREEISTI